MPFSFDLTAFKHRPQGASGPGLELMSPLSNRQRSSKSLRLAKMNDGLRSPSMAKSSEETPGFTALDVTKQSGYDDVGLY